MRSKVSANVWFLGFLVAVICGAFLLGFLITQRVQTWRDYFGSLASATFEYNPYHLDRSRRMWNKGTISFVFCESGTYHVQFQKLGRSGAELPPDFTEVVKLPRWDARRWNDPAQKSIRIPERSFPEIFRVTIIKDGRSEYRDFPYAPPNSH